jgi:hypothetical protein
MDQCSILYVGAGGQHDPRMSVLRTLGFRVEEREELPSNEGLASYHAVIVRPAASCDLPMLAARLRAKPHFGRRVLMALVTQTLVLRDQRDALLAGFDATLSEDCGARDMAATILRLLRPYPEYRCLLRSPGRRRKAA